MAKRVFLITSFEDFEQYVKSRVSDAYFDYSFSPMYHETKGCGLDYTPFKNIIKLALAKKLRLSASCIVEEKKMTIIIKTNKEVFIQFAPIRTQLIHNSMKFRIYLSKSPKTQGNFNEKLFSNGYNAELLNKRCTRCDTPLLGYGDDCNRCMKCNKLLVLWKMLSADRNKLPKELDIGGGIILTDRVLIRRHLDFAKVRLHNESEIKEGIAFKCESCKRHTKVEYLAKGSKNRCKRCVAHAIENKRIGEVGGGVLLARELAKQRQQTPQCELASKSESENNMIAKFLKDKSCQL